MLHVSIKPEAIFHFGPFAITNSLLTTWIGITLLVILIWWGTRDLSLSPKSAGQMLWEMVVDFLYDLVSKMTVPAKTKEFFPLIATLFLFILIANWVGLIPGVGTINLEPVSSEVANKLETVEHLEESAATKIEEEHVENPIPLFRAGTADLNTTLALAVIAMFSVQYYALKHLGLAAHLHKFFNFSGPIQFFVGILELVSEFSKIISFAFRLFGNVFAGEVLLSVTLFLVPIFIPLPFLGLEVFVGVIQAFVFAMLTLVFLVLATEEHAH